MTDARLELWEALCTCDDAIRLSLNVGMCLCLAPYEAGLACDACPSGIMLVKEARATGHRFWGCSNYRKNDGGCRHTMRYGPPYDRPASKRLNEIRRKAQEGEGEQKKRGSSTKESKAASISNPYEPSPSAKKARLETPEHPVPSSLEMRVPCVTPAAKPKQMPPSEQDTVTSAKPNVSHATTIILSPQQKTRLAKDETIVLSPEQKSILEKKRQLALARQREQLSAKKSKNRIP